MVLKSVPKLTDKEQNDKIRVQSYNTKLGLEKARFLIGV